MMPKTLADKRAAQWIGLFLVVCLVALLVVDRLPIPEELKTKIKRTLWTAILAGLGLVLVGVAALALPWTAAAGLAAAAFAAAGGVWALTSVAQQAAAAAGGDTTEGEERCGPGDMGKVMADGTVCLGLEY